MFNNLNAELFSPLGKEYCMYFYILTVISFLLFAISTFSVIYYIGKGKADILGGIMSLMGPALLYFNNRLLYSMCVH